MNYIKQVCYEMKHQRIMVWVSVCGTAIAVFLVMAFFLTDRIRNCSVAPATQRDFVVALALCFVLNLLCSFFPALRASKVEPAQWWPASRAMKIEPALAIKDD